MLAQRAGLLLLVGIAAACPEPNPNFIEPSGSDETTTSTTTTSGVVGGTTNSSGPMGTGDGGGSGTMETTAADTTGSTDSTASSESSTTSEFVPLGFPCTEDADCDRSIGAECCTAVQCLDTCMVPCEGFGECPMGGTWCAHGYCLFPCDDDDADCEMWPGYTCQHFGNTLCEND